LNAVHVEAHEIKLDGLGPTAVWLYWLAESVRGRGIGSGYIRV